MIIIIIIIITHTEERVNDWGHPLLISSQPHAQTLPLTYSALLSLCSLHFHNTHTHTHTQAQDHYLALPTLSSKRTLFIFFALSTPAAQDHFPPGHRHCQNHCTLQSRQTLYISLQ